MSYNNLINLFSSCKRRQQEKRGKKIKLNTWSISINHLQCIYDSLLYFLSLLVIKYFISTSKSQKKIFSSGTQRGSLCTEPSFPQEKQEKGRLSFTIVNHAFKPHEFYQNVWKMIWLAVSHTSLHYVNEGFWLTLGPLVNYTHVAFQIQRCQRQEKNWNLNSKFLYPY